MGRIECIGEWIATGKPGPWIIQIDARANDGQAERRHRRRIFVHILPDEVIADSCTEPNRGLPVAEWVPCDSETRLKVTPMGVHARLARKARVTWIRESG